MDPAKRVLKHCCNPLLQHYDCDLSRIKFESSSSPSDTMALAILTLRATVGTATVELVPKMVWQKPRHSSSQTSVSAHTHQFALHTNPLQDALPALNVRAASILPRRCVCDPQGANLGHVFGPRHWQLPARHMLTAVVYKVFVDPVLA